MLAQLDGMNVVTAAPLERIVSLIRADVDKEERVPGDQPIT